MVSKYGFRHRHGYYCQKDINFRCQEHCFQGHFPFRAMVKDRNIPAVQQFVGTALNKIEYRRVGCPGPLRDFHYCEKI